MTENVTPERYLAPGMMAQALRWVLQCATVYRITGRAPDGFNPDFGICQNAMSQLPPRAVHEAHHIWQKVPRRWPRFSGSAPFPVPAPDWRGRGEWHRAPETYRSELDKWTGPYGDDRIALIEWLLQQPEVKVNERKKP